MAADKKGTSVILAAPSMALSKVDTVASSNPARRQLGTTQASDQEDADSFDQIWYWNQKVPATVCECIHDRIIQQAKLNPDRSAVTSWDGELTYGQLDRFSEILAAHLLANGAGPGTTIPLCFNKSIWAIVSLMGVLRSGSTVTMTDPSQPEQRLRTIADEVAAKVVLTSVSCRALGHTFAPDAMKIAVDGDFFENLKLQQPMSFPSVQPHQTMYIIFTSGSTGKPKGVMISHQNYISGAIPRAAAVGYQSHSRVLDFPSYAFDVSYDCMLCTLANNGCICVPSDDHRINDLSGAIRDMAVNMAHMTPSVARLLDGDIVPSLEVLGVGGEALSICDTATWTSTTKVVNAYGPSECTVGCTINNQISPTTSYITIGKGCGGCTWVCDPNDHATLSVRGEIGELLIEGPIVGQGYLGSPEKTKEVFVEDPIWLLSGHGTFPGRKGRLYKTGDLVRYDEDGALVFVGRKDQQVKIRGQRVELGEIEHHLRLRLSKGSSVAAEVINPKGGEPMLVAFIADSTTTSAITEVTTMPLNETMITQLQITRQGLIQNLPSYMVPTAYISLTMMPLLVSLKVDRKRLRHLGEQMSRRELSSFVPTGSNEKSTSGRLEARLRTVWDTFFEVNSRKENANHFFALGGDSLKAMRLVGVAKASGLSITVSQVLQNPFLSDLAVMATEAKVTTPSDVACFSMIPKDLNIPSICAIAASTCEVNQNEIEDVYPCTPLQEGLMALSSKVAEAYISQRVVRLADPATAARLKIAFQAVEQQCEILRTRIIQVTEHGLFQVVLKSGAEWGQASNLHSYLMTDRGNAMDLGKPLVRYATVASSATAQTDFVLTMHHALYDGWSMPLFIDQVSKAYHLQVLQPLPSFKLFIDYLHRTDDEASRRYWQANLAGVNSIQFPYKATSKHQAKPDSLLEHYIHWDKCSNPGTTLANIIRGAWAIVASSYCGSDDVVFGETLTGRTAPVHQIEQLVAPLITTVPFRLTIDRNMTTLEYLQAVQKRAIDRMPHEHFGLQNIRRLSPDARTACDLGTGLVIHPYDQSQNLFQKTSPACDLMPAGDVEAAREALKFNSYALMLVCTQDTSGFLTMASFDSKLVQVAEMERVLRQFEEAVHFLSRSDMQIKAFDPCDRNDLATLRNFSLTGPVDIRELEVRGLVQDLLKTARKTWIVHSDDQSRLLPPGAIGQLILEVDTDGHSGEALPTIPEYISTNARTNSMTLYPSNQLAKYRSNGSIQLIGPSQGIRQSEHRGTKEAAQLRPIEATSLSDTGSVLRRCWSRFLNMDELEISSQDNFFELGADSIMAMKLVSELRSQGFSLTVAEIFANDDFESMANRVQASSDLRSARRTYTPFSTFHAMQQKEPFSAFELQKLVLDHRSNIIDAYPLRPLQSIAVEGTIKLPRFSIRYELFHFDGTIDQKRLFDACQLLVDANEILRTVFVQVQSTHVGVVVGKVTVRVNQYDVEEQIQSFSLRLCELDAQTRMPLGTQFVKFFYVQESDNNSVLIMRISHAQYDEVCLPSMLRQLESFYNNGSITNDTIPFSRYVNHIVKNNNTATVAYWKDLLHGSSMSILKPEIAITYRKHFAISRAIDISSRPKAITVATLPSAAWALCLARKLSLDDVTFGEVVSGRNIDFQNAENVMGPCWQYIPTRVQFDAQWTGLDLLNHVQRQHAQSGRHASMGLEEIVKRCTDWSPETTTWFDSVVHQDVAHAETLDFPSMSCRMETFYPHEEPLREWKIQAFHDGDCLTLEVVTFESWQHEARILLEEVCNSLTELVNRSEQRLFP